MEIDLTIRSLLNGIKQLEKLLKELKIENKRLKKELAEYGANEGT